MTHIYKIIFLCFMSVGLRAQEIPELSGPVMDEVGVLSLNFKSELNQYLQQVYKDTGVQLQVFVTSSLQGYSIEEFGYSVAQKWQLGDAKKETGILLLIAPNDRRVRIEVGRGLEGDLPDVTAKRILREYGTPYFKEQQYELGISKVIKIIFNKYLNVSSSQALPQTEQIEKEKKISWGDIVFAILFLIFILISKLGRFLSPGFGHRSRSPWGGGGSWSGGGSSGWGGGGGGFGGGGSSDSW